MRVLFVCKIGNSYSHYSSERKGSGLFNSTRYIVESLQSRGVHAKIVEVIDNNCIDREISKYKPKVVILEAIWVTPHKLEILKKLHRTVKFYVHIHSNIPFLANEGHAIGWLKEYAKHHVGIICNSKAAFKALKVIVKHPIYLPNVYIPEHKPFRHTHTGALRIASYGAIRPLKNQLIQAMAALKFAEQEQRYLYFYINSTRVEQGGNPVLKNLMHLFSDPFKAKLVMMPWLEPKLFRESLSNIDIGMQVSLSETFNVVTADYVSQGVPVVVSKEVGWVSNFNKAEDDDIDDIVDTMHTAYKNHALAWWNQRLLDNFSCHAQQEWYEFIKSIKN